jgi:hypothetical protein
MSENEPDKLGSFIDEARHLTTQLNIFVSDMIRDKDLVRQLDHEPEELRSKYGFSQDEIAALCKRDMPALYRLGLHPFLLVRFAGMVGILEYWKALGAPGRRDGT